MLSATVGDLDQNLKNKAKTNTHNTCNIIKTKN